MRGACVMADRSAEPWYPTAAYLYVLHLDGPALAWEYLRRNPDYRREWVRHRRRSDAAHAWGLHLLEDPARDARDAHRSEEHTSELQSLMRISYAVFCLKKKITKSSHRHSHDYF